MLSMHPLGLLRARLTKVGKYRVAKLWIEPIAQLVDTCCDLVEVYRLSPSIPFDNEHDRAACKQLEG